MARSVQQALQSQRPLLVEAGTGSGKTLAYLLPLLHYAIETKQRVAVSTDTRSLQRQILERELPAAQAILGEQIRAEICLGAANFICKRKLKAAIDEGSFTADGRLDLNHFLEWESHSHSGIRDEYPGFASGAFWARITRNPDDCLGQRCSNYDESYYFLARERWRNARLLILNHSLLAAHLAVGAQLLPEFAALVVDEAHRFPEAVQRAFAVEASVHQVQETLLQRGPGASAGIQALTVLRRELERDFRLPPGGRLRPTQPYASEAAAALLDQIRAALRALQREIAAFESDQELDLGLPTEERNRRNLQRLDLEKQSGALQSQARLLAALIGGVAEKEAFWLSRGAERDELNLHLAPIDVGPLIADGLHSRGATIFCSATLTATGADPFRYFRRQVGLEEKGAASAEAAGGVHGELQLHSPFDYARRCLLYLPEGLPDPKEEIGYLRAAADECARLLALSDGGAFLLYTSARALEASAELLREKLPDCEWIVQTELGPVRSLARFRELSNPVLLGLASFWQGVDIPGDRLRLVVINRLPFRVPDDPVLQAQTELLRQAGRDPFVELQLPQAALALKQGFGRLLRSNADRGAVVILDPRIRTRRYGHALLESLPPARQVHDWSEFELLWGELFADGEAAARRSGR